MCIWDKSNCLLTKLQQYSLMYIKVEIRLKEAQFFLMNFDVKPRKFK